MKNLTPEMIEKAKAAKTAEELLELAKANGVEMTADEAKTYFAQLNPKSGELSDDDLDAVAGGGCGDSAPEGLKKIGAFTNVNSCVIFIKFIKSRTNTIFSWTIFIIKFNIW